MKMACGETQEKKEKNNERQFNRITSMVTKIDPKIYIFLSIFCAWGMTKQIIFKSNFDLNLGTVKAEIMSICAKYYLNAFCRIMHVE